MQNLRALEKEIFSELKNILKHLTEVESADQLIAKSNEITELNEKVAFLKLLNENKSFFETESEISSNTESDEQATTAIETITVEIDHEKTVTPVVSKDLRKESIGLNIDNESFTSPKFIEEHHSQKEEFNSPTFYNVLTKNVVEQTKEQIEENHQSEKLDSEQPLQNEAAEKNIEASPETLEESMARIKEEKKIKLAHIKGLNAVPSLFDNQENEILASVPEVSGTFNMEGSKDISETNRQEFRLDLNDKLAFTKVLFGGSQVELNRAISKLNSFQTLDDAKEYLSDEYYERNWQKVDEYAQRLWSLVESKFI